MIVFFGFRCCHIRLFCRLRSMFRQKASMASSALSLSPSSSSSFSFRAESRSSSKPISVCFSNSSNLAKVSAPYYLYKPAKALSLRASASVSVSRPEVRTGPEDLVSSILSKVTQSDGGVLLKQEEHDEVANVACELQNYCVDEPVKSPLIFGDWDVVYCSRPTSPGGGYRSAFGRLIFKTKEMTQVVEAPDVVRNKVAFSALGFLDGEVSLKGKLKVLDSDWIQVVFEPPQLKIGSVGFQYGWESEVKLQITYVDEKIRLGKGSRGSLFVFQRKN